MTTGVENVQVAVEAVPKRGPLVHWDIFSIGFVLVLLVGVAVPVALLIWQSASTTAPVRTSSVGTFVSATASQAGYFSPTLTNVQTTTGSVVVQGMFSAPRGRVLAVEELNTTGLQLCAVGDLDSCLPLAGHWAGQLIPSPQAAKVFNFVGHGLGSDNLNRWMGFGSIFAFIGLMGVLTSEVRRRFLTRIAGDVEQPPFERLADETHIADVVHLAIGTYGRDKFLIT